MRLSKKKNSFLINGQVLNTIKKFDIEELKPIFANLFDNIDLQEIEFSSKNNFSFNINKNLKFNNFKVQSIIELDNLTFNGKHFKIKSYLPNFIEDIKFKNHKIAVNYEKNKFDIKGNGNFLLEDKLDTLSYQIIKNKNNFSFNSKINLKNNSLLLNFLD